MHQYRIQNIVLSLKIKSRSWAFSLTVKMPLGTPLSNPRMSSLTFQPPANAYPEEATGDGSGGCLPLGPCYPCGRHTLSSQALDLASFQLWPRRVLAKWPSSWNCSVSAWLSLSLLPSYCLPVKYIREIKDISKANIKKKHIEKDCKCYNTYLNLKIMRNHSKWLSTAEILHIYKVKQVDPTQNQDSGYFCRHKES